MCMYALSIDSEEASLRIGAEEMKKDEGIRLLHSLLSGLAWLHALPFTFGARLPLLDSAISNTAADAYSTVLSSRIK